MTNSLQAITKVLKCATSRWENAEQAFQDLPVGQVVIVHLLNYGHQSVVRVEKAEDINKLMYSAEYKYAQILGCYCFDVGTWGLMFSLLQLNSTSQEVPELFEEQLMRRLLLMADVRHDLTMPVPEDMEEFYLSIVGDEQCINLTVDVASSDHKVEGFLIGHLMAPKGTVAMYWPAIIMERESFRRAEEWLPEKFFQEFLGSPGRDNVPFPGMGAPGSKDFPRHAPSSATEGLSRVRNGQAGKDLG